MYSDNTMGRFVGDQDLEQITSLFRLLSDKTRVNILMLLTKGQRNVTSLCEALQLPQPTVSHHLGLLRMNKLIANRRSGKQVFYELSSHVNANGDGVFEIHLDNFAVRLGSNGEDRSETLHLTQAS